MLGAKDNQTFFGQKRVCPPSTRGLLRMFAADANVGEHVMIDRPNVRCEKYHVILHVADVGSAVEFYTQKLGFWLAFTENEPPTFAGVNLGAVQLFLERGTPHPQSCALYFVVDDADALQEFHRSAGVEVVDLIGDRVYGLRDYTIRDISGYHLTFGHHPEHCPSHE